MIEKKTNRQVDEIKDHSGIATQEIKRERTRVTMKGKIRKKKREKRETLVVIVRMLFRIYLSLFH